MEVEFLYSQSVSVCADQNSARTVASTQLPVQTTIRHIEASSDSVSQDRTFRLQECLKYIMNIWFKVQCCEQVEWSCDRVNVWSSSILFKLPLEAQSKSNLSA